MREVGGDTVMTKAAKENTEKPTGPPIPISPIYYSPGGMARLHQISATETGWLCTCNQPDCEHIEFAKEQYKQEKLNASNDNSSSVE